MPGTAIIVGALLLASCSHPDQPDDTDVSAHDTGADDTSAHDTSAHDTSADDTGADDTGADDTGADDTGSSSTMSIAIPAYYYPDDGTGGLWDQSIASAPTVDVMVFNPASGPGGRVDTNYQRAIATAQAAGVTMLGYVSTRYGERSEEAVLSDIDKYYDWYSPDGIFLDEGPGTDTCDRLQGTYQSYADAVHAHGAGSVVVVNPGTETCESYLDFMDILLVFEDSATRFATWTPPTWLGDHSPDRYWVLTIDTADEAAMTAVVDQARAMGVGRVYITDDTLPNPWDTLPSWWDTLVSTVATH